MKRVLFVTVILFSLSFGLRAQGSSSGETLLSVLNDLGSASVKYSMSAVDGSGKDVAHSSGRVDVLGEKYRLVSDELEIACNGISKWIYSPKTMELVITKSESASNNPIDNPLLFLSSSKVIINKDGSAVIRYSSSDSITYIVYVSEILPSSDPFSDDHFTINADSLEDDVIVTDLR